MNEKPLVTVGGLLVAPDGEILLIRSKKWKDLYSLPGGKVEGGESRKAAFIREVREETGLEITNLRFAIVQDCIFSSEFWEERHFVMNDYVADLDPSTSKEQVKLNEEAYGYAWVFPEDALSLPLHRECRCLIEWYLEELRNRELNTSAFLGFHHLQVNCIMGIYPEEREKKQVLWIDVKVKVDLKECLKSRCVEDTVDYAAISRICTELAESGRYLLLESLASDIAEECLRRFPASWVWVSIKKPAAIPTADYALVEVERSRDKNRRGGTRFGAA